MSESSGDRRKFRGDGTHDSEERRSGRPVHRRGQRDDLRQAGREDDRRQAPRGRDRGDRQARGTGQWRGRDERRADARREDRRDDRRGEERRERRGDGRGDDRRQFASRGGDDRRRTGGAPRDRSGRGSSGPERGRDRAGGPQRREPRRDEPDIPEDVEAGELDSAVRRDLLSLDKNNANAVARHLVMASRLIDDDPRLALAHARAARQRAGRIAVVRETAGITAYRAGEWAEALSELRAARRMSGGPGFLSVMADCERGLGRPERAIELGRSDEARQLTGDDASELRMVVAGARMDLGQFDQAVVTLQTSDLDAKRTGSAAARLFYAYADALVAAGRTKDGLEWFLNSAAADLDGETDAEERVAELTGEG
ncbi:hypothetical protein EF834_08270 [Rhodococcus spongiicola]|uniref:Tetratrico peptide repeat group 5 domain-containing protein n=1 Tax=Rhodococcus spongiicola TaxID=2487352 RepID=A0A3S3ZLW4_9NOCA|nr:hypothetical protein [Rhodococcus spongiicola]RVW03686.1 hypothetical protein EF834_08270 [Rhodococcus spongiicola]